MTRRRAQLAVLVASVAILAGCAVPDPVVTRLPSDQARPVPSATPSDTATPAVPSADPGTVQDCAGAPVALTAGSPSLVLRGDCPSVQVEGNDLAVDLSAADIDVLGVEGDRLTVTVGETDSLTLQGNDSTVTARDIDDLTMTGDRNTVTATDSIDAVTVDGNDNVVRGIDDDAVISDGGARNSIQ
ncbi:DUF3060 domain-containing protein [Microbacterium lushaniae]|uniref:DUF3060 domain-containing protein n=1 Tax=Microbacterium lushaniae TaxID=2614639 RepID=A0A5J6L4R9_9MICO|nr:DUF3060 domain-containing protein [Microbacterium lushaniae]QEW03385.1 DUF3060 domain-containing protein [Microbacterium lushaniae]